LRDATGQNDFDGAKIRLKYIDAPIDSAFYWGMNEELGRTSLRATPQNWNLEVRPILGYRYHRFKITVNPILDFALSGTVSSVPSFNPATRLAYRMADDLTIGVEHYSGMGLLNNIQPSSMQTQNTYLILDTHMDRFPLELGIGRGWTNYSDKLTIKAIFSCTI
jgi:hypothetical protein